MFRLVSFDREGKKLEHSGKQAAFYGLYYGNSLIQYYNTVQALNRAVEEMNSIIVSEEDTNSVKEAA